MVNEAIIKKILDQAATTEEGKVVINEIDYAIIQFMFKSIDMEINLKYIGLVEDTVVYADIIESGDFCCVRFRPNVDPDLLDVIVTPMREIINDPKIGEVNMLSLSLSLRKKKTMQW